MDLRVNEETLINFFKEYRSINSIKIILDPQTKMSRGYGFVKFTNYFEFQRALQEMNGRILMSKAIKVNQAGPRKNYAEYLIENNSCNYNSSKSAGKSSDNYNNCSFSSFSNVGNDFDIPLNTNINGNCNYDNLSANGNFLTNSGLNYNSTYPNNFSTKFHSSDSFKTSNSFKNFVNASVNGYSGCSNPNASGISVNNSVNDELNCGEFSKNYATTTTATTSAFNSYENFPFENILDSMENSNKVICDDNYFNSNENHMSISDFHGTFMKNFSNFYENRKCPVNNFLNYYYNIIDMDKKVNFLEQFYISFSKYGHSYDCNNGKIHCINLSDLVIDKSKSSARQDYLLNQRENYCSKPGESFYKSDYSAMGTN